MRNKINFIDLLLLLTLFMGTSGVLLAKANKTSLNKVISGKAKVKITVYLPDVHSTDKNILSKDGEPVGVTIRNRPYKKLKLHSSTFTDKEIILASGNIVKDPFRKEIKDYTIVLVDEALVSNDGYTIDGNKVKIGNQIELEGFKYRLKGKVIDISPYND